MNEVAVYEPGSSSLMTAASIRAQVNRVQEVMSAVMKPDVHYGKIPGTPKPTLYKPGAEVLCATFHIAVSYRTEDLSTADCVRYRMTAIGTHQASGIVLGEGIGEASSNEEKYKWRKAVSNDEFAATDTSRRRVKYYKDGQANQIRTEPADVANTILKMAAKRAQVGMTLNVTAASDCFAQDIEDLPAELLGNIDEELPTLAPKVEADLLASLDECVDAEQLREKLKVAMQTAKDAGDVNAHKRIKEHALKLMVKFASTAPRSVVDQIRDDPSVIQVPDGDIPQ